MDTNLISLITQKNNIFDHIFYEMKMYRQTYIKLKEMIFIDENNKPDKQFWINVLIESHATHLRNLIHFFSGKDTINVTTVLVDNPGLGISNAYKKTRIIDKAISHLTKERVDSSTDANNITVRMNDLIHNSFSDICGKIKKYLEILADESAIKREYLSEFGTAEIQEYYRELTNLFA